MRRLAFVRELAAAALAPALPAPGPAETPRPDPQIDRFFARTKLAWRARVDPPYVRYRLTETYEWRDLKAQIDRRERHDWIATLRTADRRLALVRQPDLVPSSADAFTVLDPPIVATDSFGFVDDLRGSAPRAGASAAPATPVPRASGRLGEIARTEAFVRDYVMENVGVEFLDGEAVQHLLLVPRHEPEKNRLRDLWATVLENRVVQLSTQGLFRDPPYDGARWLVRYVAIDGRPYVHRVFNVEDLNFGGQLVRFLAFECGAYEFPASVADGTFA